MVLTHLRSRYDKIKTGGLKVGCSAFQCRL